MQGLAEPLINRIVVGRTEAAGAFLCMVFASGCSTYEEYTVRDKVAVAMEIESFPEGAEVYIAHGTSDVLPGRPGEEWVAKGGFAFAGRTPLQLDDEIVRSTKGTRKIVSGGVVIYDAKGPAVYQENARRIVLLKPGYRTVDATERIGPESHLRFTLAREEGSSDGGETGPAGSGVLDQTQGKLSIVSNPSPAEVEIDGRYIGETPASVQLPPGPHHLLLRRAGYAEWQREIDILSGSDQKISPTLERRKADEQENQGKSP